MYFDERSARLKCIGSTCCVSRLQTQADLFEEFPRATDECQDVKAE